MPSRRYSPPPSRSSFNGVPCYPIGETIAGGARPFTPTRSGPDISDARLRASGDGRSGEEEQVRRQWKFGQSNRCVGSSVTTRLNTHFFAANGSQGQGDVNGVQSAPPPPSFPPTNAQGQRICRQCGLPGRYKEGKCVEKWGPGPQGPGTVCDRCRKKMKRVERRGTLEGQQLAAQTANAVAAAHNAAFQQQIPSVRTIQAPARADTMPMQQYKDDSSANLRSAITNSHRGRVPLHHPALRRFPKALSHRIPVRTLGTAVDVPRKPAPRRLWWRQKGREDVEDGRRWRGTRADADADGSGDGDGDGPEEDGDALRELAEIAGVADEIGSKEAEAGEEGVDADAEADAEDAEADLLEAVDAAEANSSNSSAGGSWMKSESL
ncbi:L30e protein [Salix suchowensis]|nr:L30e protein [Salix suchowensis]